MSFTCVSADIPPNVVLIVADDYGWRESGFMGSQFYETPHLDQLASEGIVFKNGYAPSANCAPSRASILTGKSTTRHGMFTVKSSERGPLTQRKLIPTPNVLFLDSKFKTVAQVLKGHGYETAAIGKWHISQSGHEFGFNTAIAGNSYGHPKTYWAPFELVDIEANEGDYLTDRLGDEAVQFISENKTKPFFLYLPFFAVHDPLEGKPDLVKKYKAKKRVDDQGRYPNYAAMIETMDDNIGRVMSCLKQYHLEDDTLVIFTSDNGGAQWISDQAPLKGGKGSYYEGGIRVPFILKYPKSITTPFKSNQVVTGLDIFPTIIEAANIDLDSKVQLDGMSIFSLLKDGDTPRPIFWHFPIYLNAHFYVGDGVRDIYYRTRPGSAMRFGNWKLHEYFENNEIELFDLSQDLGESNNLAKKFPEKAKELYGMLKHWREKTHAPIPNQRNPYFDPSVRIKEYEYNPQKSARYVSNQKEK